MSCESISLSILCKKCQKNLLEPDLFLRELEDDLRVYSFYEFEGIKNFIESKYYFYGDRVYNILGKIAFKKFAINFNLNEDIFTLPIMDKRNKDFHHTSILAKYLKTKTIKPLFGKLVATNDVKYAGKSLEFRKNNPRDFQYSGPKGVNIILVDDVVTTGSTLLEAKKLLENYGCTVLFALTLSDAKN